MRTTQIHPRIVQHPFASLMQGALLNLYDEKESELVLGIQGLQVTSSELFEHNQKLYERITGQYVPLTIKFSGISQLNRHNIFLPPENPVPSGPPSTIAFMLSWRQPTVPDIFHIIGLSKPVNAGMNFFAHKVMYEIQGNLPMPVTLERDWSSAPPLPDRLVPQPNSLYKRFGGDPITVQIKNKFRHRRLFIGGLDVQLTERPQVDVVLNLGEEASHWVKEGNRHFEDRTRSKGEGSSGMTVEEIYEEADWVIEHLKENQRVLVHCVAGMNRSTTICCAVLILLEGLSAEAALERVREHHPWARPDSHHWLALRWLASNQF
jgi:Dual specificity phosphatase, catalytic domain